MCRILEVLILYSVPLRSNVISTRMNFLRALWLFCIYQRLTPLHKRLVHRLPPWMIPLSIFDFCWAGRGIPLSFLGALGLQRGLLSHNLFKEMSCARILFFWSCWDLTKGCTATPVASSPEMLFSPWITSFQCLLQLRQDKNFPNHQILGLFCLIVLPYIYLFPITFYHKW